MKNVLELLENSEKKFPNKTLFTDEKIRISYKDFTAKAKAIGSYLSEIKVKRRAVAVYMDNSVASLIAFMGVVYSGNFYVVIDAQMPANRIKSIFKTLSPAAVLVEEKYIDKAKLLGLEKGRVISFERALLTNINYNFINSVRQGMIDTDPLYALFTSGSTGEPKGTMVCHKSVLAYAEWVKETFDIDENTVFGNQTPFYFSMSVLDIFSTIKNGATMHIIPRKLFSFPIKLLEYINDMDINTIYWVPSALCIIANWKVLDYVQTPNLKKVLFAGEVMPTKQLNYWMACMPNSMYANLYGPTEVTDICTYYIVNRKFENDEPIPIGNACNNCDVMIIKSDGTEAAFGEEGELHVRGSFLAMGYYNNSEKTSQVFVQNPLNSAYPEIVYKTGDLVKYNSYGEIVYITRKDFQIKHMGYRIELGEIEAAVNSLKNIKACVSVFDVSKDKIILVYQGDNVDSSHVLNSIKEKLPQYMHPGKIIKVDQMPYNANGKIDRAWLRDNYESL